MWFQGEDGGTDYSGSSMEIPNDLVAMNENQTLEQSIITRKTVRDT